MNNLVGKNQSFCREINFELVVRLLKKQPYSSTQLSELLELSNATMSSITKDLLDLGLIDVASSASIKGCGRKQVFYALNENFGLILVVNIDHLKADISLTNVKEELIDSASIPVEEINEQNIQKVILKANELLFNNPNKAPLKNIIISITGLVKDKTESNEKGIYFPRDRKDRSQG